MLISPSAWTSSDMVSSVLFTPFSSTDWFRTVTPASYNLCAPRRVTQVISFGWLMCVWMQMCLPACRARLSNPITVSTHPSFGSSSRLGDTPSPLLANRKRRMWGVSSSRSPMYCTCSGSRRYVSPPEITMSRSEVVFSM